MYAFIAWFTQLKDTVSESIFLLEAKRKCSFVLGSRLKIEDFLRNLILMQGVLAVEVL